MVSCSCVNGYCQVVNGTASCVCNATWAGTKCDRCALGYHLAGASCVPNVNCTSTSCNGHGRCSDTTGAVVCGCNTGYVGAVCDSCAQGFVGYPNCSVNATDNNEGEACTAPVLPNSLNLPEFLGYTGSVRIKYFLCSTFLIDETKTCKDGTTPTRQLS